MRYTLFLMIVLSSSAFAAELLPTIRDCYANCTDRECRNNCTHFASLYDSCEHFCSEKFSIGFCEPLCVDFESNFLEIDFDKAFAAARVVSDVRNGSWFFRLKDVSEIASVTSVFFSDEFNKKNELVIVRDLSQDVVRTSYDLRFVASEAWINLRTIGGVGLRLNLSSLPERTVLKIMDIGEANESDRLLVEGLFSGEKVSSVSHGLLSDFDGNLSSVSLSGAEFVWLINGSFVRSNELLKGLLYVVEVQDILPPAPVLPSEPLMIQPVEEPGNITVVESKKEVVVSKNSFPWWAVIILILLILGAIFGWREWMKYKRWPLK